MKSDNQEFVEFLIKQEALLFGNFTLKSGRVSPYFFNAGQFNSAHALSELGKYYAKAIVAAQVDFDMLFGPAYKGIPIVSSMAISLYNDYGIDIPISFNRKEKKSYGEGGEIIGAPLKGRILLVDDVVSSGTTFRESAKTITQHSAKLVGLITALDRQERGTSQLSAIEEIEQFNEIKVINIIKLDDVIGYLKNHPKLGQHVASILSYQQKYGCGP